MKNTYKTPEKSLNQSPVVSTLVVNKTFPYRNYNQHIPKHILIEKSSQGNIQSTNSIDNASIPLNINNYLGDNVKNNRSNNISLSLSDTITPTNNIYSTKTQINELDQNFFPNVSMISNITDTIDRIDIKDTDSNSIYSQDTQNSSNLLTTTLSKPTSLGFFSKSFKNIKSFSNLIQSSLPRALSMSSFSNSQNTSLNCLDTSPDFDISLVPKDQQLDKTSSQSTIINNPSTYGDQSSNGVVNRKKKRRKTKSNSKSKSNIPQKEHEQTTLNNIPNEKGDTTIKASHVIVNIQENQDKDKVLPDSDSDPNTKIKSFSKKRPRISSKYLSTPLAIQMTYRRVLKLWRTFSKFHSTTFRTQKYIHKVQAAFRSLYINGSVIQQYDISHPLARFTKLAQVSKISQASIRNIRTFSTDHINISIIGNEVLQKIGKLKHINRTHISLALRKSIDALHSIRNQIDIQKIFYAITSFSFFTSSSSDIKNQSLLERVSNYRKYMSIDNFKNILKLFLIYCRIYIHQISKIRWSGIIKIWSFIMQRIQFTIISLQSSIKYLALPSEFISLLKSTITVILTSLGLPVKQLKTLYDYIKLMYQYFDNKLVKYGGIFGTKYYKHLQQILPIYQKYILQWVLYIQKYITRCIIYLFTKLKHISSILMKTHWFEWKDRLKQLNLLIKKYNLSLWNLGKIILVYINTNATSPKTQVAFILILTIILRQLYIKISASSNQTKKSENHSSAQCPYDERQKTTENKAT